MKEYRFFAVGPPLTSADTRIKVKMEACLPGVLSSLFEKCTL